MSRSGFTLIELMIVVAIIAFLATLTLPSLTTFLAKAKRTEAYVNLSSLATAEKAYFAEHGKYTKNLRNLGWKPEGNFNYTYGFADGSEGVNYFVGKSKAPSSALNGSKISDNNFVICAASDIDNDGKLDVIAIDQNSKITILEDDLL